MTADPNIIDLPTFVAEHLERAEPDLLRSLLKTFVPALLSVEADAVCGAASALAARSEPTPATADGPGTGTTAPARSR